MVLREDDVGAVAVAVDGFVERAPPLVGVAHLAPRMV
jgi:hypothetical protein